MAYADWDNLTSITREKVLPAIIDQIGKAQPLLGRLFDGAKEWKGGTSLQIPVKFANQSAGGSYSGLDTLTTTMAKTRTRAKFAVKQIYQPIVLSNIDLAQNGGEKVADLMATEMEEAKESLKDKFCTQLFGDGTGNSAKDLTGLNAAIDDGTNVATYGDIDRSTYTWFKAGYTATVGSLTLGKLATAFSAVSSGTDEPSIIVTTKVLRDAYEALLQPQVRIIQDANLKADGGLKAFSFRGVPIIVDEYCPAGAIYLINEKYVQLWYMKHPKFPTDSKGFTVTPLRDPINQDGQVGFIFFYGQLTNSQPRRSGRMVGVTA